MIQAAANDANPPPPLVLLLPVYNDWECAQLLLTKLDKLFSVQGVAAHVIFLDDGSTARRSAAFIQPPVKGLCAIESLRLRRNLGHQRAIAVGLSFVFRERSCDTVVVMDTDGEDKPEDVLRLLDKYRQLGQSKVVFAERIRRSENWIFRFFYHLYRWLHRVLTGIPVRIGNFSVLSRDHLSTLVVVSETWNHYAASIIKARIPYEMLPTARGVRLAGRSKLNFVGLVVHGLSAISVFAEVVGVRLLLAIMVLVGLVCGLILLVIGIRIGTNLGIPGWATSAAGILLIIVLQMFTMAIGLTFSVLFNRNNLHFLPIRDYQYFVGAVEKIYEREQ